MIGRSRTGLIGFLFVALAAQLWAGGSGLNVVIVVNQASTNSVQLGNYYQEQRQVPPQNFLRITWPLSNSLTDWAEPDYNSVLLNPLLAMLATRQLTNQIDYIVLSMDIPYRLSLNSSVALNSTTSALFYGLKPDPASPCSMAPGSTNRYAGTEGVFRYVPPISAASNSFLVTMITSSNLALAKQIVDSGVAGDSTCPTQTVWLIKGGDVDRNVRFVLFDHTVFDTRVRGNCSVARADRYGIGGLGTILGAETGEYYYGVYDVAFVPGSLADNMTSYGGAILDTGGHLSMLAFLAAGAAGTYGTLDEPCNYLEKFPSPQNYFYQARGFSLAECYYQSVTNPYQGLLVGEPLAAPFAQPCAGAWKGLPPDALLNGVTNLTVQFNANDTAHPVQQVDLFVDGHWQQTLTNIPLTQNNLLYVTLNGASTNFTVPAGATLKSITSNLTARLNATAYSNATKVAAFAHGDRIELQSLDRTKSGSQVSLTVSNSNGSAAALTTFLVANRPNFLDTVALGRLNLVVNPGPVYPPPDGAWLLLSITKTNGLVISIGSTNDSNTLTNVALLVSNLVVQADADSELQAPDGCSAEDFIDYSLHVNPADHGAEFNLLARTSGWNAAQIRAALTASSPSYFSISPAGTHTFEDNLPDLRPRAHIYTIAGVADLPFTFPFNTAAFADGFHQLTVVGYEGSHVRTQGRASQTVLVRNSSLAATFTPSFAGSNADVSASVQFSVSANSGGITNLELFSTGGSFASVQNQSSALFTVGGTSLGVGLHPFYAVVTDSAGRQYRTQTLWVRFIGPESPFSVALNTPPPVLSWPVTLGRSYEVLSANTVGGPFQLRVALTPSNSPALWVDTNPPAGPRFYRVRVSN